MLPIGRDDLAVAITEETWKAVSGVRGDDERMRGKRRAEDERRMQGGGLVVPVTRILK